MVRDPEVEIVNDLISTCFESAAENRAAAVAGDDEARTVRLQMAADQLYRVARALQRYVRQRGAEPEDENNLLRPELIRQAYQRAKAVIRGKAAKINVHGGTREALRKFREVLGTTDLSPALRQIIEVHYRKLESQLRKLSGPGAAQFG